MTYTFKRRMTRTDWPALPRAFDEGETVSRYNGHDYGLVSDDLRYGGIETIACTLDGKTFFTVPLNALSPCTEDKA